MSNAATVHEVSRLIKRTKCLTVFLPVVFKFSNEVYSHKSYARVSKAQALEILTGVVGGSRHKVGYRFYQADDGTAELYIAY